MEEIKCSYDSLVDIHKLQKNPKNPNNHPDKQIDMLAKIIDYQGMRNPIVVSNRSGFVVKGHGRLAALVKLGWSKAPVDYQDYDSEAQEYADMIADNKIAELAVHDDSKMIDDLKEIDLEDFDLLGIDNFNYITGDSFEDTDNGNCESKEVKYIIEVTFKNDMEMMDIHDDLTSRGYIVKIK